ncbi:MAG: lysine--tRNA ligase, partial [Marmoricola sp.]
MTDQHETANDAAAVDDLPEQMQVRRDKRARLLEAGKQAYPIAVERTHTVKEIRETWDPRLESGELEPD